MSSTKYHKLVLGTRHPPVTAIKSSHVFRGASIWRNVPTCNNAKAIRSQSLICENPTNFNVSLDKAPQNSVPNPLSLRISKITELKVDQRVGPALSPWLSSWRYYLYLAGILSPPYDCWDSLKPVRMLCTMHWMESNISIMNSIGRPILCNAREIAAEPLNHSSFWDHCMLMQLVTVGICGGQMSIFYSGHDLLHCTLAGCIVPLQRLHAGWQYSWKIFQSICYHD